MIRLVGCQRDGCCRERWKFVLISESWRSFSWRKWHQDEFTYPCTHQMEPYSHKRATLPSRAFVPPSTLPRRSIHTLIRHDAIAVFEMGFDDSDTSSSVQVLKPGINLCIDFGESSFSRSSLLHISTFAFFISQELMGLDFATQQTMGRPSTFSKAGPLLLRLTQKTSPPFSTRTRRPWRSDSLPGSSLPRQKP